MDERPAPLRPLTAFRFFAAFAVVLVHTWYLRADPALTWFYDRVIVEGLAAVPFFFVLSGFVLAYNYHDRFPDLTRSRLRDYLVARLARAYPLHLLTLAVTAVLFAPLLGCSLGELFRRALAQALLIQAFVPKPEYYCSFNFVSWTLSAEAFGYVLLPVVLWAVARRRTIRPAHLVALAAALWGLQLALSLALAGPLSRGVYWAEWVCFKLPPVRFLEFAAGALLGVAFVRLPPRSGSKWAFTGWELAALMPLAALVWFAPLFPYWFRTAGYYTGALMVVVFAFAFQRGHLSALLSGRALGYLGEISFGAYMLHFPILFELFRHRERLGLGEVREGVLGLIVLALTLAVAAASHRWFESPLRRYLTRRGAGAAPAPQLLRRAA